MNTCGHLHLAGRWWTLEPHSISEMRSMDLEPWERDIVDAVEAWFNASETMELVTSGSTGPPKRICHSKAVMADSALRTAAFFSLGHGARAALGMPVRFVGGMMMVVRAIVNGWRLRAVEPKMLLELGMEGVDFLACTPSQAMLLEQQRAEAWGTINMVLMGGGASDATWVKSLAAGPEVYESFGMTETVSHFAIRKLHPHAEKHFRCLPGFTIETAPTGALAVETPWGVRIETNDAVDRVDAHTFTWLGRLDDVINSGGIKVHPERVEAVLSEFIEGPFRCYGVPDLVLGHAVRLRIHAEGPPVDAAQQRSDILAWATAKLPAHHAPKSIEWAPLEQTDSGKWKRPRA